MILFQAILKRNSKSAADSYFRLRFHFFSGLAFLARGLGVKVKGRVEKQDCNEQ